MILVTGASGITGLAVTRHLVRAGLRVRALTRGGPSIDRVREAGASDVTVGGFDRATLREACAGVRGIYHVCPNVHPEEIAYGEAVIDAALAAAVPHVVFQSVIQPQLRAMPHHWAKLEVESRLMASGLTYTILQPTVYMQNLRFQWQDVLQRGVYEQPYRASARLTLVDVEDLAAAAAVVLCGERYRNATIELAGTAPLDRHEMAAILTAELGREVRAAEIDRAGWYRETASRLGEGPASALRAMFEWYDARGLPAGSPELLTSILGRAPCDFRAFVRRMASSGGRG